MQGEEDRRGDGVHVDTDRARAGSSEHVVRYVLAISLALAIVATSIIWITGAVGSSQ